MVEIYSYEDEKLIFELESARSQVERLRDEVASLQERVRELQSAGDAMIDKIPEAIAAVKAAVLEWDRINDIG